LALSDQTDQMRAALSVNWLTRVSMSVWKSNKAPPSLHGSRPPSSMLIRLSVVMGQGPEEVTVAVSGDGNFQDPWVALQMPEFDMEPDKIRAHGMWLVVEGVGLNSTKQMVEVILYSDAPVRIGAWEPL
jgi:calpain-7